MPCRDHRPDFSLSSATQLLRLEYKSCSFSFRYLPQQPLFPGMHRQLQEGTKLVQPCKLSLQLPAPLFGCCDLMALPESRCHLIAVLPSLGTWKGARIPWWRIQHGCVKYRAGPANCCEAAPAVVVSSHPAALGLSLQPFRWLQPELFTICTLLPCAHTKADINVCPCSCGVF